MRPNNSYSYNKNIFLQKYPMANYSNLLTNKIFTIVGDVARDMGRECYVVGGYVRDLLLNRHSKDIDFVTVGSGIELAQAVGKRLGKARVNVFRNYGTASVMSRGMELEFVGARRESYHRDSRNPIVEDGTLDDDIARRDFTINAMALSVTPDNFGELIDHYDGIGDLEQRIIRTPGDPDITFSDDPLRMLRAVRFATQLEFTIDPETFEGITRNAKRLEIITASRIRDELMKIMAARRPSIGWDLMLKSGLLKMVLPELAKLRGVETVQGRGHKDNFYHTLQVLDNVAEVTDDVWTRWGALLHDIAKPATKRWDEKAGWTFHNHNFIGAKMVPSIFSRLTLPMGEEMRKVRKLVELHMRPIALVEDIVTDSAVRRLMNYAENDLESLMILARADITSKNLEKKQRFLDNFDLVEEKFKDIAGKDKDRAFRPALNGNDIMLMLNLGQSPEVGYYMGNLTRVSKDCEIGPSRQDAIDYIVALAAERGITADPSRLPEPTETEETPIES
jgi:poly(A) polymerase